MKFYSLENLLKISNKIFYFGRRKRMIHDLKILEEFADLGELK